jgi:hypothetical protein
MNGKFLEIVLSVLIIVGVWEGLAYIILPGVHTQIETYITGAEQFEREEGVSCEGYARATHKRLLALEKELGKRYDTVQEIYEDESSPATGK